MLEDATLQTEAAQAAAQIAGAIRGVNPELATSTLEKIVAVTKNNPTQRAVAESILNQINASSGFITAWQFAGPYEESGKGFDALFDTAFAPEKPDGKVSWKLLPAGTNPQMPYVLDFLKAIGGEQRVAYARTRVYSPSAQKARLELGSDDGVKVWLNGKVVYAKNIARPIVVGSDKVDVDLQEGWNVVMLKVTQNNLGWEFCARFVKPDGGRLGGLKADLSF
jgi:hypothetical protein